jgi:hypothetical protein
MTPAEIMSLANVGIRLATAGIEAYTRAIDAANAGDMETAMAKLAEARDHFGASQAAWDAAGQTPEA